MPPTFRGINAGIEESGETAIPQMGWRTRCWLKLDRKREDERGRSSKTDLQALFFVINLFVTRVPTVFEVSRCNLCG